LFYNLLKKMSLFKIINLCNEIIKNKKNIQLMEVFSKFTLLEKPSMPRPF
jgi:hypothetical protein